MKCRVSGKLTHGQRKPREIGEPGNDGICSIIKGRGQDSMYFEACFIMGVAHATFKLLDTLKVNVSVQWLVSLQHNSEPASPRLATVESSAPSDYPRVMHDLWHISSKLSTQLPVDPV